MEVHRQTCQQCQSIDLRNIIVREGHSPTKVFVRCAKCKELVALYELNQYYHHGKGIESYLRSHSGSADSGREWLSEFEAAKQEAETGFAAALEKLEENQKEI